MSLDVWLEGGAPRPQGSGIWVRRDGRTVEISRDEWDRECPDIDPVVFHGISTETYSANITHNLADMAKAAGLYDCMWRAEDIGLRKAKQLIEPLEKGLATLLADPGRFKMMNPRNGWGSYETLVDFVKDYLEACSLNPESIVRVSR